MQIQNTDNRRPDASEIIARLAAWGLKGGRARCPAHAGRDRNLSVDRKGDKILLRCFSHQCTYEEIIAALGVVKPLPEPEPRRQPKPRRYIIGETGFDYYDPGGRLLVSVKRRDFWEGSKKLKRIWRDPAGAEAPPAGWPLYRVGSILIDRTLPVLFTEGEKAAEAAVERLGHLAIPTTTLGGAGSAARSNFTPVCGRAVVIWPDADDAGRRHAADLYRLCKAAGADPVTVVDTTRFPHGWDLADPDPEGNVGY